jgi:hypothetical protein
MRYLITLSLIGFVIAGCASSPSVNGTIQQSATSAASEGTNAPVNSPGNATDQESSGSSAMPLAVTVRPPSIFVGPIDGTPSASAVEGAVIHKDWQTFTSSDLGVVLDYPPDWSMDRQGETVTFTSPQGKTILLQTVKSHSQDGQNCTSVINSYGLTVDACIDTATSTYSAGFNLVSAGAVQRLILSTTDREALGVYKAMFSSVRQAP